jgi:hypothetical protein
VEDVHLPWFLGCDPRLVWSFYKKRWEDAQLATPTTLIWLWPNWNRSGEKIFI